MTARRSGRQKQLSNGDSHSPSICHSGERASAAMTELLQVTANSWNASASAADCAVSPGELGLAKVTVFVPPSKQPSRS